MKTIPLTKGKETIVDDEDYEFLMQWKWYASKIGRSWYALRSTFSSGKRGSVYMHREIVQPEKGQEVDHINHNGLDNRRSNIRLCSHKENLTNVRPRIGYTSHYRGVHWYKNYQKWCARIMAGGQNFHVGYFDDEKEAAKAYNEAAIKHHGEFARLNDI